jgi:hypothetical protein
MVVPVVIALACFVAGVLGAARWLPDLAPGRVGGIAFFAVTGLLAAALVVVGLRVYAIVAYITESPSDSAAHEGEIFAAGVIQLLYEAGALVGLAGILYLLAPAPDDEHEPTDAASPSLTTPQ